MQQISTPELLVKHLYHETDAEEATLLQHELEHNAEAAQSYVAMQEVKGMLDDDSGETPGASVINKILEFSKEKELTAIH